MPRQTKANNEQTTIDERHYHFYKYTGGEWDSGSEVVYKFKCECGQISTDLCGSGHELSIVVDLNSHWWELPDCSKTWKWHDWTVKGKDIVCRKCKYRIKDYETTPKGYKERCIESKLEYEGDYGNKRYVHYQCIVVKDHKYNHRFAEKRER